MNVEASPNWLLKNSLSDCAYQNNEKSLRRNMTEIKTYEEVYTGNSKGGCMAAKFGRRTTVSPTPAGRSMTNRYGQISSTSRHQVKVWDLNDKSSLNWILNISRRREQSDEANG